LLKPVFTIVAGVFVLWTAGAIGLRCAGGAISCSSFDASEPGTEFRTCLSSVVSWDSLKRTNFRSDTSEINRQ